MTEPHVIGPESRFTVYGTLCSNNMVTRRVGDKSLKSKPAREDTARVREIATVAVTTQRWEIPEAAFLEIIAWNCRKDVGNVEKVPCDALKGIALRDDADLMDLRVSRRWDDGGERYVIAVYPVEDRRPGRKAKKRTGFRSLDSLRSGDTLSFHERDELLKKAGVR